MSPALDGRRPVIFLGPSLPLSIAEQVLPDADYRPPIRRGDLDGIPPGTVVGIIDGVFADTLAISPGEIRAAIHGGAVVLGAASMGALRATEIPAVMGVGRVYQMYRDGVIERDDEVAVLFEEESYRTLTVPLVNIRYAVERLVRTGTFPRHTGDEIVAAAEGLHYADRTYASIFATPALAAKADAEETIALLRQFDLKREDAQLLLEYVAAGQVPEATRVEAGDLVVADPPSYPSPKARDRESADAPLHIWESGDTVSFAELVEFLKVTGQFDAAARAALLRLTAGGTRLWVAPDALARGVRGDASEPAQALLDFVRLQWGWESPEETHVTMGDLGLGLDDVSESLHSEVTVARLVVALGRHPTGPMSTALRAGLWIDDLALKREVLRLGAVRYFAKDAAPQGEPTPTEYDEARRCIARLRWAVSWPQVCSDLGALGVSRAALDEATRQLALARRATAPLVDVLERPAAQASPAGPWTDLGPALDPAPKASGSRRFSLDQDTARATADDIARQMGVVRIGMVGELTTLGVHIAQAFAQRSGWSASFASGKAETVDAAKTGAIMEEAEIQAQDAFRPPTVLRASFDQAVAEGAPVVPPDQLGLPFDSWWTPQAELDWAETVDLVSSGTVLVPTAILVSGRLPGDILYSPRLGGKIFSSSGLGSGFTLAEAATHAVAELVERHATRLAELEIDNPGQVGCREFRFVDLESLPDVPHEIVAKYERGGMRVRLLDITSEIRVPTFYARIYEDPFAGGQSTVSDGFAAHPDPEVAATMALLEAAQTQAGFIAGGREDFSLQARSLGRHERPRLGRPGAHAFWFGNDRPLQAFDAAGGHVTDDVLDELRWMVGEIAAAGLGQILLADLTVDRIAPAYAVRAVIPGSETTNPLCTGDRGRATCIRDLLPRGRR
jgi:ribosomal protein S12 methylthiotransferase accessory factor